MSKGIGKGSRDVLLKFSDTFHISGTVGACEKRQICHADSTPGILTKEMQN